MSANPFASSFETVGNGLQSVGTGLQNLQNTAAAIASRANLSGNGPTQTGPLAGVANTLGGIFGRDQTAASMASLAQPFQQRAQAFGQELQGRVQDRVQEIGTNVKQRVGAAVDEKAAELYDVYSQRAMEDVRSLVASYKPWIVALYVILGLLVVLSVLTLVSVWSQKSARVKEC